MRNLLILLSLLIMGLTLVSPVASQEISSNAFDAAYKSYLDAQDAYKISHEEYLLRRSQYLRFKTLKSQQDAQLATAQMLKDRDDVVIAYLRSLKARQQQLKPSQESTSDLISKIDEEIGWYREHKENLNPTSSLDDLVASSNEAKSRYDTNQLLFYQTLSTISSYKITNYRQRLESLFERLKKKVSQIKEEQREEYKFSERKLQVIDQWIIESEGKIAQSQEKQDQAIALIAQFPSPKQVANLKQNYNKIIVNLTESQELLEDASSFLAEVIREIKTAED